MPLRRGMGLDKMEGVETEAGKRSRHSWWWAVVPLLLVVYVLGMGPLNAWADKQAWAGHLKDRKPVMPWWKGPLNAPLNWAAFHSETAFRWSFFYQRWWNRKVGVPVEVLLPEEVDSLMSGGHSR